MKHVLAVLFFTSLLLSAQSQNPTLKWVKGIGGTSGDDAYSTATDAAGNIYVMGTFWGTVDMDPGPSVVNLISAGQGDIYISKFDAAGNFIWVKQIGNNFNDVPRKITIDNNGNLYLAGEFNATLDLDPGPAVFNLSCNTSSYEAFLLKLDTGGNFVWANKLTDTDFGSSAWRLVAGASGDIYVAGLFKGTGDFDPGTAVFTMTSTTSANDIFISKFDNNGNFIWAKQFTGVDGKACYSVVLDPLENIYLTGTFYGTCDFDPGAGIFNLSANNTNGPSWSDVYVTKLDKNGIFVFAKQISGVADDVGWGMTVDATGAMFITGEFSDIADFDPGAGTYFLDAAQYPDAFVLKLDYAGNFAWVKQFAGAGSFNSSSRGFCIALDNQGNVYSTGDFTGGVDFNPGPITNVLNTTALEDTYISKLNSNGDFVFAVPLSGNTYTECASMLVNQQRDIIMTGLWLNTTDFDPTSNVFNLTSAGLGDAFVLKLSQPCSQASTSTINATACNTYTLNGQTYTISGTYTQTLINAAGCDSIITLALVINGFNSTANITACDSYFWQGQNYTSSGIYHAAFIDIHGCDSILNLNLLIKHSVATNINVTICQGLSYEGYTSSGTYTDTYTASNGCDSVRTLNLIVKPKSVSSVNAVICEGESYAGHTISGTYIDTYAAANGCDSIRTLYLIANPRKLTSLNASICQGQTYFAGGHLQTISGIYKDTLRTYLNCDSIITTNLVVHQNPTPNLGQDKNLCAGSVIVLNPGTYTSYLWQDMSTLSTYTAGAVGLYWVTVTDNNNCTATDSFKINTIFQPPVNFLKQTDSICSYDKLVLQPINSYSNYLWSDGSFQSNITIQNSGQYWLQVTDINGCKGLDTISVISKTCKLGVFIPTAFTPNGDGKNDFFRATVHGNLLSFKLEVFNRYGELVFQTTDPSKEWSGFYKGATFSTSTFVWQCHYQLEGKQSEYQKGTVLLIR